MVAKIVLYTLFYKHCEPQIRRQIRHHPHPNITIILFFHSIFQFYCWSNKTLAFRMSYSMSHLIFHDFTNFLTFLLSVEGEERTRMRTSPSSWGNDKQIADDGDTLQRCLTGEEWSGTIVLCSVGSTFRYGEQTERSTQRRYDVLSISLLVEKVDREWLKFWLLTKFSSNYLFSNPICYWYIG